MAEARGPLAGLVVVEMSGMGGAPFAAMMLADMGARVIRVDRAADAGRPNTSPVLNRGKQSICMDLKAPGATAALLRLVARADVLIESFRPGVMERLGLGPAECAQCNPRLVYGRLTGWGNGGPLSATAGHDINYLGLSGVLAAIGTDEGGPLPPLALVGDYAGGGMLLVNGLLAALWQAGRSGRGQVVDAAMLDGASLLMANVYEKKARGQWSAVRGENLVDGGRHYYTTYRCADGKWIAIGAIEDRFYGELLRLCGLPESFGRAARPNTGQAEMKAAFGKVFATKTRNEWCALLEDSDACFAAVLDVAEAPLHPHNIARGAFCEVGGIVQPVPAPRFGQGALPTPAAGSDPGADTDAVMSELGFSEDEARQLRADGAIA